MGFIRANVNLTNRRTLIFVDWTFLRLSLFLSLLFVHCDHSHIPFSQLVKWYEQQFTAHSWQKNVNFTWEFVAITAYRCSFSFILSSPFVVLRYYIKYLIKMWTWRTSCYKNRKECKVQWNGMIRLKYRCTWTFWTKIINHAMKWLAKKWQILKINFNELNFDKSAFHWIGKYLCAISFYLFDFFFIIYFIIKTRTIDCCSISFVFIVSHKNTTWNWF